jgi:hypothetical protein
MKAAAIIVASAILYIASLIIIPLIMIFLVIPLSCIAPRFEEIIEHFMQACTELLKKVVDEMKNWADFSKDHSVWDLILVNETTVVRQANNITSQIGFFSTPQPDRDPQPRELTHSLSYDLNLQILFLRIINLFLFI